MYSCTAATPLRCGHTEFFAKRYEPEAGQQVATLLRESAAHYFRIAMVLQQPRTGGRVCAGSLEGRGVPVPGVIEWGDGWLLQRPAAGRRAAQAGGGGSQGGF